MSAIDMHETLRVMSQLLVDEIERNFRCDTPRWFYEMHPATRDDLINALVMVRPSAVLGLGKFCVHDIPVEPAPWLARDAVRLVVGIRCAKIVRTDAGFSDEGRGR